MNTTKIKNYALANPDFIKFTTLQKLATVIGFSGLIVLFLGIANINLPMAAGFLTYGLVSIVAGIALYSYELYGNKSEGIKNDHVWQNTLTNRGLWGWLFGILLTTFYVVLYFYPTILGLGKDGAANTGVIALFDPLSKALSGNSASQWFVYGTLYTLLIFGFGIKFIWKYRHNRYHVLRTISIMFFQTAFAFLIPEFMARLNGDIPYYDLKNMWPLNYYLFYDWNINGFINVGTIGLVMLIFGVLSIFIISPLLTYFYGKRWYCSWVCGCGGLAETTGDPFRQLSDKSVNAWKVERWTIYSVLVFSTLMTIAVISTYLGHNNEDGTSKYLLSRNAFLIGVLIFLTAIFAWVWKYKKQEMKKDAKFGMISYFVVALGVVLLIFSKSLTDFTLPKNLIITLTFFLSGVLAFLTFKNKKRFNKVSFPSTLAILAMFPFIILYGLNYYDMPKDITILNEGTLKTTYGFLIGSMFSGVIGTGFYPILGNRVWCRFGCPMAAILGLQQRLFSKFRITTNGGQCISCGNCSTYCEMGIDVRAYAQKGENIVRASCVGCGICSAVCPRGVLKLENDALKNRLFSNEILLGNDVDLMAELNPKK